MNILYVEDDPVDADLTRRWCTQHASHMTLDMVDTVQQARHQLAGDGAAHYDMILTDMRLPDGDGLDVLRTVQELTLDVPVVLITGVGDDRTVVTALKAGATDYIVKRAGYLERLPTTLEHALHRYHTELERRVGLCHILYAEADAAEAALTQRSLARMAPHLQLSVVTSGPAVLEHLVPAGRPERYDVLLLDYRLPGLEALELAKELREVWQVDIPIVLVTDKGSEEAAVQALRLGVSEYIVKEPGYLERLPWILEHTVARAALLHERARLKESVQRFEAFMSSNLTGATLRDAEGRLLYANPTFRRTFGLPEETWRGQTLADVHTQERAERLRAYDQEVLTAGVARMVEESFAQRDGVHHWLLAKFPVLDAAGEKLVGTMGVDVTERRRAQEEVETRARQLHRHNTALARLSRSTTFERLGITARLQEILQVAAQTLGTARVSLWLYEEDQQKIVCRALYELAADRHSSGGALLATAYPAYFHALASSRVIAAHDAHTDPRTREFSPEYLTPLGIAALLDAPLRVFGRHVGVVCHEHLSTPRLWSQEEETLAASVADFVSMALEAEEHRRDEDARRALEAQVREAQKMEALGTLAGGIAHDFNNILSGIFGHLGLAALELETPHPVQARLAEILRASERGRDLVRQILTFSRQQPQQRQGLTLQAVVTEALSLWRATLPATIALHTDLDAATPPVLADPTQIHQVVMNLCTNAAQAIGRRQGTITIRQRTLVVDAELARTSPALRAGRQYVQLTVQDSGPGMDAATLARIFEPFFTTKAPGQGTGLGLAVVHGIMQSHDGAVTVASQLGQGTTFCLFFPVAAAAVPHPASPPQASVPGAGQHILFLDDEAALARLGQHMLERLGYRVTSFTSATDALEAVRQTPQAFDLVLADWSMPGINGLEVAHRILELQAPLPLVLVSGRGNALDQDEMRRHGVTAVLHKPFTLASLREIVASVLQTRTAAAELLATEPR